MMKFRIVSMVFSHSLKKKDWPQREQDFVAWFSSSADKDQCLCVNFLVVPQKHW